MNMMRFPKDYAATLPYIKDMNRVESNYYEGQRILEYPEKDTADLLWITVNSKGYNLPTEIETLINGFHYKVSRKLWKRKSRYKLLPFFSVIEQGNTCKSHFHGLLKINDLPEIKSIDEVIKIVRGVLNGFKEVNAKDSRSVKIVHVSTSESLESYQYRLIYMLKESTHYYDPLFHYRTYD